MHAVVHLQRLCSNQITLSTFSASKSQHFGAFVQIYSKASACQQSAAMASKYSAAFTKEFTEILAKVTDATANEVLQEALACLKKYKHTYVLEHVLPKYFLTHKSNRGGLMLSPRNAHRNAARIRRVGADLKQLTNAVAMELAPSGTLSREAQVEANMDLIRRSDGLLAEVNGEERYLSLGCGHTVGFCKKAEVGGRTTEPSLADSKGQIDLQKIKQNSQFKVMLEQGWTWQIVEWGIDEAFPAFAKVAQKALNVSNHVATTVSELETALQLGELADDPSITSVSNWQAIAIENVVALNVPASSYAAVLLDFVQLFGGGRGSPMILFMDNFCKQFQCNLLLGETFWKAVTQIVFPSKLSKLPLLRVSLCMGNLSSPKVEDGIGRCIVKSDISKLATKAKFPESLMANEILEDALDCVQQVSTIEQSLRPLGKLFVRVGLTVTNKGDSGLEQHQYSFAEAKQLFLDGLSEVVGTTIQYSKWTDAKKPASAAAAAPAAAATRIASLSDHSDPVWIAKQAGFEVGKTVVEKGVASDTSKGVKLWAIFSIGEKVSVQQMCSYTDSLHKAEIDLPEFLTKWAVTKDSPPLKMPMGQQRPDSLSMDCIRCRLYQAIQELDATKQASANSLVFWRRPDEVRSSSRPIPAGSLQLAPVSGLVSITPKFSAAGCEVVDKEGRKFYVLPVCKPSLKPDEGLDWPADALVAPYWWVGTHHDKKLCNMEVSYVEKHGFKIPVLTNPTEIGPFSPLLKHVKMQAPEPSMIAKLNTTAKVAEKGKGSGKQKRAATPATVMPKKTAKR